MSNTRSLSSFAEFHSVVAEEKLKKSCKFETRTAILFYILGPKKIQTWQRALGICFLSGFVNSVLRLQGSRKCEKLTTDERTVDGQRVITIVYGSFSDNFNFSMKKASRAYNFCSISKRHVVFRWQSVGQIKTRLNAKKYKKRLKQVYFLAL